MILKHRYGIYVDLGGGGGGHILERHNVERPTFRNYKITNIKITKDELLDSFIFKFNFSYFKKSFEHPKYLIIFQIVRY